MKLKLFFSSTLLTLISSFVLSSSGLAAALPGVPAGCNGSVAPLNGAPTSAQKAVCDSIPAGCPGSSKPMPKNGTPSNCPYAYEFSKVPDPAITSKSSGSSFLDNYLTPFINFLSASVGVIVVISIIIGAIQYSSAGGEAQKVAAARNRIKNAILALIVFLFLYAILQWVLPTGIGG